jgi:hypothetical protein
MKDNMSKDKLLAWAFSVLKEHADANAFGNCIVSMANGKISSVKCEINHKAPVDEPQERY